MDYVVMRPRGRVFWDDTLKKFRHKRYATVYTQEQRDNTPLSGFPDHDEIKWFPMAKEYRVTDMPIADVYYVLKATIITDEVEQEEIYGFFHSTYFVEFRGAINECCDYYAIGAKNRSKIKASKMWRDAAEGKFKSVTFNGKRKLAITLRTMGKESFDASTS
jgi:hypothetical protein